MKPVTSIDLGRTIKSLRKALGVTQEELALTSGTNRRFIIDLERGKPTCHLGKALRVLQTLGARLEVVPPTPLATPAHDEDA